MVKLGLVNNLLEELDKESISYILFDKVQPNPSIQNAEDVRAEYLANQCDAFVAFGGGSPMDCAKGAAARITNPNLSIIDMKGMSKIKKALPPLYAIPTTSGTGSETTSGAVFSNPETHEKFALVDAKLMPLVAVLDPSLTLSLPKHITAATGIDALTHAVEAALSVMAFKYTDEFAEKAVKMIFENIEVVYNDGQNLEARNNMALASYYAGVAFTRVGVGYVHAIAHNFGGLYGIPHGLANAILLPLILDETGEKGDKKLSKLAIAIGLGAESSDPAELAQKFREKVRELNTKLDIPTVVKELKKEDIPLIAQRAAKEANPGYAVPKIFSVPELENIIQKLLA